MTGTNHPGAYVPLSGANLIDSLTFGTKFSDASNPTIYYGFSLNRGNYGSYSADPNHVSELPSFSAVTGGVRNAVHFAMEKLWAGSEGFSIEGFTLKNVVEQAAPTQGVYTAHVRYGQANLQAHNGANEWGYASPPATSPIERAGDVWLKTGNYNSVVPGTIGWYNVLHETGHAMGLKHPFEKITVNGQVHPVLQAKYDAMEFTVMSYKSYSGEVSNSLGGNGQFDYAQSFMMLDIRALQHIYGADFSTNSGPTTYKWNPANGDTLVNGQLGIDAGGIKIFATIWDGGGVDTYDLTAYTSGLKIDLRPGGTSVFSSTQLAYLGDGQYASGNIYNAILYNNDSRSLIENAKGGSGNDSLIGNFGSNTFWGNAGSDAFNGLGGNDFYYGGTGSDSFIFVGSGDGRDTVYDFDPSSAGDVVYLKGSATLRSYSDALSRLAQNGANVELRDTDGDVLVLKNITLAQLGQDDFYFG